jgi:hypothetical protein
MKTPLLTAQHYHDQADHMRELAAKEDNLGTRRSFLQLAQSYDRLCKRFIDRAPPPAPSQRGELPR